MVYATWQVGQLLWSMLWFALFFMLIYLVIGVFMDVFRSPDLSGWAKALWTVFILFAPWLGIFVYLLARGGTMSDRRFASKHPAYADYGAYGDYGPAPAPAFGPVPSGSPTDDLAALADLRTRGIIDEDQFQVLKQRALAR